MFLHLAGFTLWLGGAAAAMAVGIAMRKEAGEGLGAAARMQGAIYRSLVGPGALLTVFSGLILTLQLYGTMFSTGGLPHALMMMQAAGLLGALVTLLVTVPTAAKVLRVDPVDDAPVFNALRGRVRRSGMAGSLLALLALVGGALLR